MADCNVCLSLAGGLMRQNLFLEFVRDAILILGMDVAVQSAICLLHDPIFLFGH